MSPPLPTADWVLVLGENGEARAELALRLCSRLRDQGQAPGGFLQLRDRDEAGRPRQVLAHVGGPERLDLAVRGRAPRGPQESDYCNYAVADGGFRRALEWVRADAAERDVLVLGDLGRMEAAGLGHTPSLEHALRSRRALVLAVQESQLFWLLERFGVEREPAATLSPGADEAEVEAAARALAVSGPAAPPPAGRS